MASSRLFFVFFLWTTIIQCSAFTKAPNRIAGRKTSSNLHSVKAPRNPGFISDSDAVKYGVGGIVANVICDYSLYVLKETGCGLPPGPLGLEGAAEGISYSIVIGILFWSGKSKIQTGGGLPAGPFGLLGLAEGLTFLTIVGGIFIAFSNLIFYGFLPGFLPNDKCFGL